MQRNRPRRLRAAGRIELLGAAADLVVGQTRSAGAIGREDASRRRALSQLERFEAMRQELLTVSDAKQ